MRRPVLLLVCALALFCAAVAAQRQDAFIGSIDHPAIAYRTTATTDAIGALNQRLRDGSAALTFDPATGYLKSVLEQLSVPVESQLLVFSPTSLQASLISMQNPRAVYFNDAVSVGWVRGSDLLELSVHDPKQGVVFYSLDQRATQTPQFVRDIKCLQCHLSWETLGVPGLIDMSMYPMPDDPNAYANGLPNDHRSPFVERWGGWYVTGNHGGVRHMGNIGVLARDRARSKLTNPMAPRDSIAGVIDLTGYLTPYSDVEALMVLAHQARATNLITRAGWEARTATGPDGAARVTRAAAELAEYLLFVDEVPLLSPIRGTSGFAKRFAESGPRDARGRSLRQMDLTRRMMRYPCSYLIYSEAFDGLPSSAKDAVYARMWEILSGRERAPRYARLTLADRQAVVEILRETRPGLPQYFQPVTR